MSNVNNTTIEKVLNIVQKEIEKEPLPIVTLIGQMNRDPFKVLIATMLSLRTQDAVTASAAKRLFARADTPQKMRAISETDIAALIYPVGFYRIKAKQIVTTCQILIEKYDGTVPKTIDELIMLPGVGRKTANLVLIEGYRIPAMCVDTHVHRISNRWGYVKTPTPEKTEEELRKKLPKKHWLKYNTLLVSFGQHRCGPTSPRCSDCPIRTFCPQKGVHHHR